MSTRDSSTRTEEQYRLRREALNLHRLLFAAESLPELTEHYTQAHEFIKLSGNNEHFITVQKVIAFDLDAEAVELALRTKHFRHPLRQKIQILTYLAETDSRHYHLFINDGSSFTKAIFICIGQLFRTVYKMIKGHLIVWRYSLV